MESGTKRRQVRAIGLALAAWAGLSPALGAAEDVYDDYGKLNQTGAVVSSPGDKLFGDNINLYNGSMEAVTDTAGQVVERTDYQPYGILSARRSMASATPVMQWTVRPD